MALVEVKVPDIGDFKDVAVIELLVKPGDRVKKGQVVAIVDTSKAAVDVEIWFDGTVHELLIEPGAPIPVGTVLATLLAPGEKTGSPARPTPVARSCSQPPPPACGSPNAACCRTGGAAWRPTAWRPGSLRRAAGRRPRSR